MQEKAKEYVSKNIIDRLNNYCNGDASRWVADMIDYYQRSGYPASTYTDEVLRLFFEARNYYHKIDTWEERDLILQELYVM